MSTSTFRNIHHRLEKNSSNHKSGKIQRSKISQRCNLPSRFLDLLVNVLTEICMPPTNPTRGHSEHRTTIALQKIIADPMVGYWCRVGSLALTHTHNDIAILVQRRTLLSIFSLTIRTPLARRLWRQARRALRSFSASLERSSSCCQGRSLATRTLEMARSASETLLSSATARTSPWWFLLQRCRISCVFQPSAQQLLLSRLRHQWQLSHRA